MGATTEDQGLCVELQGAFDALWDGWEERQNIVIPVEVRRMVEAGFMQGLQESGERYDPTSQTQRDAVVRRFAPIVEREVAKLVLTLRANPQRRPERVRRPGSHDSRPVGQAARRRNLRLLELAAGRIVPFWRLLEGSLKPGRRDRAGTPWKTVYAYLCGAHPSRESWIRSPSAFKVAYYAAARDPHLAREFGVMVRRQAAAIAPIRGFLEAGGCASEYLFVKVVVSDSSKLRDLLPPQVAAAFEGAGWPKEWLVVSAKYPAETVRALIRSARGRRTADNARRRRTTLLVCKGRDCRKRNAMLVLSSAAGTTVIRSRQCNGCRAAARLMAKSSALA